MVYHVMSCYARCVMRTFSALTAAARVSASLSLFSMASFFSSATATTRSWANRWIGRWVVGGRRFVRAPGGGGWVGGGLAHLDFAVFALGHAGHLGHGGGLTLFLAGSSNGHFCLKDGLASVCVREGLGTNVYCASMVDIARTRGCVWKREREGGRAERGV